MKIRGTLLPGEHAITATRAHGVLLARPLLYAFGAMAAWSFASALGSGIPWLRYPALVLALYLLWLALRGLVRWWLTSYIVTSHRLILRRGLNPAGDLSIPYQLIEGATVKRMALMGAVDAAQITVRSRGGEHLLAAVPEAARFSHEIRQAQQSLLSRTSSPQYSF